ncbi:MAG: HEAT repeat domain-containing protein [Planctomycetota bacterium]
MTTAQSAAERSADAASARAALRTEVEGDAETAITNLRAAIAEADAAVRPPLQTQLAQLLGRLGRNDERAGVLQELIQAPPPFGEWARIELRRPAPWLEAPAGEQDPERPPEDPLRETVLDLNHGLTNNIIVGTAYGRLKALGPLALPSLVAALPELDPFGLQNALELLVAQKGAEFEAALGALMASADPLRHAAAAPYIGTARPAAKLQLAELALQSPSERVRVAGVEALARIPGQQGRARQLVEPLVEAEVAGAFDLWVTVLDDAELERAALEPGRPAQQQVKLLWQALGRGLAAPPVLAAALEHESLQSQALERARERGVTLPAAPLAAFLRTARTTTDRWYATELLAKAEDVDLSELATSLSPEMSLPLARLLASRGDAQIVRSLVPLLRHAKDDDMKDDLSCFELWCRAVAHRSDASNLDDVLDLVALPAPAQREQDWSQKVWATRTALARWFNASHVGPALRRLPAIEATVAKAILRRTATIATAAEAPALRAALSTALEDLGSVRLSPGISLDMAWDPDDRAESCISILSGIGGTAARDALLPLLEHDEPWVREQALDGLLSAPEIDERAALRRALAPEAPPRLVRRALVQPLTAKDPDLRALAVAHLRTWPDESSKELPDILTAFFDAVPPLERGELANKIILWIGEGSSLHVDVAVASLRAQAGVSGGDNPRVLAHALKHTHSSVRLAAIDALANTFDPSASESLVQLVVAPDAQMRDAAEDALTRIAETLDRKRYWRERFDRITEGDKK